VNQIVIAPNPLEVIAAYSLDETNPNAKNTLYLAAESPVQLPDRLSEFNHVYYSSQCSPDIKAYLNKLTAHAEEISSHNLDGWIMDWKEQRQTLLQVPHVVGRSSQVELEL
jgi:hypothetical protein